MKSLLVQGDALLALKAIPPRSVQSCVTSPPYWGLRDYGIVGQIGIESDLSAYLRAIREVFGQVKRV
ncbi:MAG: site-specific DNA-methyltransferase, partial [Dehalococcoidia bacterium]|nr:site-specific DNA-methyltransferase [Dehalococcoidia bacterium]